MSKPVLQGPNFDKPFNVQVDASDTAAGAAILLGGNDKILYPV